MNHLLQINNNMKKVYYLLENIYGYVYPEDWRDLQEDFEPVITTYFEKETLLLTKFDIVEV